MGYSYQSEFFDFVDSSSGRSAAKFLSKLQLGFRPQSVLDVGCGRGVWLRAWKALGVETVLGLDGAYVDPARLQVAAAEFQAIDLAEPFELNRAFDLVECLEVAEHLPEYAAETLVSSLVRHGDLILFSAATPGQGGEHHLNERQLSYWVAKFAARGYVAFDHPRLMVRGESEIEPWYRYNVLLYANAAGAARLAPSIRATEIPAGAPPKDQASPWWKLRCGVIRVLPASLVNWMAVLKHRLAVLGRIGGPKA